MDLISLWTCVGRRDDHAIQQPGGRYVRTFRPLTLTILADHLAGRATVGTYVLSEKKECSFATFDADGVDGMQTLRDLRAELASQGHCAYLERSRRGGHLWLFFSEPVSAERVRAWLWPLAAARDLELFPKQSGGEGIGSLIRLPLGIHQRSGKRYPFVDADLRPVALTLTDMLDWLAKVERTTVPPLVPRQAVAGGEPASPVPSLILTPSLRSIREWNAAQNPFALIGHYVALDHNGSGHCPFGSHHQGGRDSHVSFRVYQPRRPGGSCWYCYTWEQGGSAFDFLRLWHNTDARTLWHRILRGETV
jgi:hypothetical protein